MRAQHSDLIQYFYSDTPLQINSQLLLQYLFWWECPLFLLLWIKVFLVEKRSTFGTDPIFLPLILPFISRLTPIHFISSKLVILRNSPNLNLPNTNLFLLEHVDCIIFNCCKSWIWIILILNLNPNTPKMVPKFCQIQSYPLWKACWLVVPFSIAAKVRGSRVSLKLMIF